MMTIFGGKRKVDIKMSSRHFIPTTIVSGFPGVGKSFIAKKFPTMVRDLESSDYHWKTDEFDNKVENPNWPAYYIKSIKALDTSGMYKNVMVSSHKMIREEMAKAGIRYTNVFPENTPEMKKIILDRYRVRGSSQEFIDNLDTHWDEYISEMENDPNSVRNIKLNPQSINVWTEWMLME